MTAAFLLCAAILAADHPAQVRAKVVFGAADEQQHRANVDVWIRQAVEKNGWPRASPQADWIALTGDERRLYTPKQGGFFINGKATGRNNTFEVEINGCAGGAVDRKVTIKPGERRVVKLTYIPGLDDIFIALEAPLSEKATNRAKAMKANAKTFVLELQFQGDEDKPFYRMILSVPADVRRRNNPFEHFLHVKEDEASSLVNDLARTGFLDKAIDLRTNAKTPPPAMPGYTMKVFAGDLLLYEDLGWGLAMIHRLDALRDALPENSCEDMDLLLGRLSGLRAQWGAEHPPFKAEAGQEGHRIRFLSEGDTTIIDIAGKIETDRATIRRESPTWPKSMLVRLHLRGLDLFNVGNGKVSVDWWTSSSGDNAPSVFLRSGGDETPLDATSPYLTTVRIGGGNGKTPLEDRYFEVPLPGKLFDRNPDEIHLWWIDTSAK